MTKIVIVDSNDRVIGTEYKEIAWQKGLIRRVVRLLVLNSAGKVYLQKRSLAMRLYPGLWDQSVGGHVDEGESYYQAAIREMGEELGIFGVRPKKLTKFFLEEQSGDLVVPGFNTVYEVVYDGVLTVQKSELAGGAWFDQAKLKQLIKKKPQDFVPACILTLSEFWRIKHGTS